MGQKKREPTRRGLQSSSGRRVLVLLAAMSALVVCVPAGGAVTTFNVSAFAPGDPATDLAAEAAYLAAVAAAGHPTFFEGFTAGEWDTARSPQFVSSVVSKGITWHSSTGDFISMSDASDGVTPWHIYSKGGSPQEQLHAVPATIIGESATTLYGIGVWVNGSAGKGKLNVILDDTTVLKFVRITGYENNDPNEPTKETIRLTNAKQFFGVFEPVGFTKFQLLEVQGVLEDQVLMWAADFTFAGAVLPGDANVDGSVDLQDFGLLKENFGTTGGATWAQGNFNVDGNVDLQDFGLLKANFGAGGAAVPEPATLSLLGIGGLALLRRRRK